MQLHEHLIDSDGNPKPVSVEVANACIRLAAETVSFAEATEAISFAKHDRLTLELIDAIQHDMKEDKA